MNRSPLARIVGLLTVTALFAFVGTGAQAADAVYVLPRETVQLDKARATQQAVEALNTRRGVAHAAGALPAVQAATVEHPRLGRWLRVELQPGTSAGEFAHSLSGEPWVEIAEPAPVRHTAGRPGDRIGEGVTNDPFLAYQWHLSAISAYAAWDELPDASDVIVAIVDNGVDLGHPDLRDILWTNEAEWNGTVGVDDDGNGVVDDVHGWDAYDGDGNPDAPSDVASNADHGTHCAGIVGAAHDNGRGVAGVAPGVQIMVVRAGAGSDILISPESVVYAALMGADVISMSYAGASYSTFERDAMEYALDQGAILVAAAGNRISPSQNLTDPMYPAAYREVIGVASSDHEDRISSFSFRGHWVDVAAPGEDIYSTGIESYLSMTGTSMATPVVAGVVALLKAQDPSLGLEGVRARIGQGARELQDNDPLMVAGGRVDAWRSLVSDRPTLLITGYQWDDADGDGVIEQGEQADVRLQGELVGRSAAQVTVRPVPFGTQLATAGEWTFSGMATGAFTSASLSFTVADTARRGNIPLALTIDADGWRDTLNVPLAVNPIWRTHASSAIEVSLTDRGAIGFNDYVDRMDQPEGFRLLDQPLGMLYHGSVMVSDGIYVADAAYGNNQQNQMDFTADSTIRISSPAQGQMISRATYSHTGSGTANVRVVQRGETNGVHPNLLRLDLDIQRTVSGTQDHYAGIYCDWDIQPYTENVVRYDSGLRLSYVAGDLGAAGVMALGDLAIAGVAAVDNQTVYDGFREAEKLDSVLTGHYSREISQGTDVSHMIWLRVPQVSAAAPKRASFALLAAESESELLQIARNYTSAAAGGGDDRKAEEPVLPERFTVSEAWPNPFNAGTSVRITLSETQEVTVLVHDVLGREVARLVQSDLGAGQHRIHWDGRTAAGVHAASGIYLVRIQGEHGVQQVRKVVLVR